MQWFATKLIGSKVEALDGEIGEISDLYFDDERWVIRYLICRAGDWTSAKWVLISPLSITSVDEEQSMVSVNLTRQAVAQSPDASLKQPVSRRFEIEYSKYYEIPIYWAGSGLWGGAMNPAVFAKSVLPPEEEKKALQGNNDESHLRSVNEVAGYRVKAEDGSIGHIEDFLIDSETWAIHHVAVDTRKWLRGKIVTIAPARIDDIVWTESTVYIRMTKEAIQESPELN
ncbi:MAG: hypothetical protein JW852_03415 [Spirochaetales bacterium]|nr:hypothetical protein [Spirochaetales bacterium]